MTNTLLAGQPFWRAPTDLHGLGKYYKAKLNEDTKVNKK